MKKTLPVMLLALALYPFHGFSAESRLLVCAPGYPGSTAEAQPAMDAFAGAISAAGGPELSISYFQREEEALEALESPDVHFVMTTLPFFLAHRETFGLEAMAQALAAGRKAEQQWSLVAGRGRISKAADLQGWTIFSPAGYSEDFVRAMAFDGWGRVPDGLKIVFSTRILSILRKAAGEEKIAVLLDGQQAASLERLPFAKDLEIVRLGPSVPVSLVCAVGQRPPAAERRKLSRALLALGSRAAAAEAMAGIRMEQFIPLRKEELQKAVEVFNRVRR